MKKQKKVVFVKSKTKKNKKIFLNRGDSIIEVLIAVAIFSAIAVAALGIMNRGLENAQASLETTIVRTEMDTQAERIRFIADSLASTNDFQGQWDSLINSALDPTEDSYNTFINNYKKSNLINCDNVIKGDYKAKKIILESGNMKVNDVSTYSQPTGIPSADEGGIWIVTVKSKDKDDEDNPYYYDFYINTCWNEPGLSMPTKLSTTIRIQNPDSKTSPSQQTETNGQDTLTIVYHWNNQSLPSPSFISESDKKQWHKENIENNYSDDGLTYTQSFKVSADSTIGPSSSNNQYINAALIKTETHSPISVNELLRNRSPKYNGYAFIGWTIVENPQLDNVKITGGFRITCVIKDHSLTDAKNECEFGDHSKQKDLYAIWVKLPQYLYCVKYNNNTPDNTGVSNQFNQNWNTSSRTGFKNNNIYCEVKEENEDKILNLQSSGFDETNSTNYKRFSWRKNKGEWGNLASYYILDDIYKDNSIEVGPHQHDNLDTSCLGNSSLCNSEEFDAVYIKTVYPQWRAKVTGNLSAKLYYNEAEVDCGFLCKKYKLLDAYVYSKKYGKTAHFNKNENNQKNEAIRDDSNNITLAKIEWADDANGITNLFGGAEEYIHSIISIGIIPVGSHRIVKYDNKVNFLWFQEGPDTIGSLTSFSVPVNYDMFYYSILSYDNYNKIASSDTVLVNYELNDGKKGELFLHDVSGGSCWHVFALDSDNNALYILNTVTNDNTSNNCGKSFNLGIPY